MTIHTAETAMKLVGAHVKESKWRTRQRRRRDQGQTAKGANVAEWLHIRTVRQTPGVKLHRGQGMACGLPFRPFDCEPHSKAHMKNQGECNEWRQAKSGRQVSNWNSHQAATHERRQHLGTPFMAWSELVAHVEKNFNLGALAAGRREQRLVVPLLHGDGSQVSGVKDHHLAHGARCDAVVVQLLHKPRLDALVVKHMLTRQAGHIIAHSDLLHAHDALVLFLVFV